MSDALANRLPIIDYARHPAYGAMFAPDEGARQRALAVLQPLIDEMQEVEAWKGRTFGYRYGGSGPDGEELARTGELKFDLPRGLIDPIGRAADPILSQVKARVAAMRTAGELVHFSDRIEGIDAKIHPELWSSVDAMLRETGSYELTSGFFGGPGAKLKSIGVLYSDGKDRPAGEEAPLATEGMHIDSAGRCILKAVLYLNDVGPEQGPFGMIPGSHRWDEGSAGRVYRRAFDRSSLVARGVKERRLFASLPEELQVKAEFGGDILAGSTLSRDLIRQESVSLGSKGLMSLFDPEAIHRGGQARAGERHAILITVRSRW